VSSKYSLKDFSYKADDTGFQLLFRGQVFQSSKFGANAKFSEEVFKGLIQGQVLDMLEVVGDENFDWQLHWDEVEERPLE
jgi:hypothetical protein